MTRHPTTLAALATGLLTVFGTAADAGVWINNQSDRAMTAKVFIGTTMFCEFDIQANSSFYCPVLVPSTAARVDVETTSGGNRWFGSMFVFNENAVNVVQFSRPFGAPDDYVLDLYTQQANGTLIGRSTPMAGQWRPEQRALEFFATGDPQYVNDYFYPRNFDGYVTTDHMCIRMESEPLVRGILVAGDLTQSAVFPEAYQWYRDSFHYQNDYKVHRLHYVFDGVGNHDYFDSVPGEKYVNPLIIDELRTRKRSTTLTQLSNGLDNPFYSWDWHDVHFVNCNLAPSDTALSGGPHPYRDYRMLSQLQVDLAIHVGTTGRPVVIMHHYGFDESISHDWWTEEQRAAFWEVIKNYNVIALINGHNHGAAVHEFYRPTGATGGPDFILAFTVGATHNGYFAKFTLGPCNEVVVQRYEYHPSTATETVQETRYVHGNGVFVAPPTPTQDFGDGSPLYPWRSIANAVTGMYAISESQRPDWYSVLNSSERWPLIQCGSGNYPGAVTITQRCRLTPQNTGDVVRIGQN
jgi:hypothetical protein